MTSVLADSTLEADLNDLLLNKNVPSHRQAYSDRTAWIMACLSELAYLRFNPLFSRQKQKDYFLEQISKLVNENKKSSLLKLIDTVAYDHVAEKKNLKRELGSLNMELLETFDTDGTQAILASFDRFIILSFRGTEATSVKDIKSDARAKATQSASKGRIHSGFKMAYEKVDQEIQKALNKQKYAEMPLFITGHSLGGALATIAAKRLSHSAGIAACYTYGSPRVGDEDWIAEFKTPVYRLVNAADCVTMLPPGTETVTAISWLLQFIPKIGKPVRSYLLSNFGDYLHGGNMRYLINCPKGRYDDVHLLYSVSLFYRLKGLLIKKLPWKHFLADHSIGIYRRKLAIIAKNRNISN
jgi:triacylglycerol lipase